MNEQTRYRVTGSLFFSALAIICIPMLFDGEGISSLELEALTQQVPVKPVKPLNQLAPSSDYVERIEALREGVDDDGFDVTTKTRFGEPVLSEPEVSTSAWAIQVASFSEQGNARSFRSDLRSQGYEAFISTTNSGSEIRHRVAVGPLLNESDAMALRTELAELLEVDARLMAFSS